jgi:hypothetical protein
MAGKYGSPSIWFLVGGYNLISNKLQGVTAKIGNVTEATHGCGDSWKETTPVGLGEGEVAQEGAYFDTQSGFIHDAMAGIPGALTPQSVPRVACLGQSGMTIGEKFFGAQGVLNAMYEVLSKVGALVRANADHQVTGALEEGVVLHTTAAAETADATTAPGSSVDNTTVPQKAIPITSSAVDDSITCPVPHGLTVGDIILISGHSGSTPSLNGAQTVATIVSTTVFTITTNITTGGTGGSFVRGETNQGGSAYLQWTSLTLGGHSGASVAIRHSTDNSTFVDLVVMTTATAAFGAERKTVAGEVRRYLAQSVDFTGAGSPSMTYFAGFARN